MALDNSVYLWNHASGEIIQLLQMEHPDDYVSSVSWIKEGNYLAVGTSNAEVQVSAGVKLECCLGIAGAVEPWDKGLASIRRMQCTLTCLYWYGVEISVASDQLQQQGRVCFWCFLTPGVNFSFWRHEIQIALCSHTDKVECQSLCSEVPMAQDQGWVSSSFGELIDLPL